MRSRRYLVCGGLLIAGGIACWFFPLFHIRPLGDRVTQTGKPFTAPTGSGTADPVLYVDEVWEGPLRTGDVATEVTRLWQAFDADVSQAKEQFGRQAGLGGSWYFCVRGQGAVEMVERNRVHLTVAGTPRRIVLELGVVVDNTVREAFGVKAGDFANSRDFNAVSSELNRRVEQEVIPPNRPLLKPGVVLDFVGCAKVGRDSDLDPLYLIPIRLEIRGNESTDTPSPRGTAL